MSSEFIERSKHTAMTAAIESHFGTAKPRAGVHEASGKGMPRGGDNEYNDGAIPDADFYNGEKGANYTPRSKASNYYSTDNANALNATTPYKP